MEKTHKIGLRTTHGRTFMRFGTAISPRGVTQLEVTAAQAKAIERECAAAGAVIEIVEPATPIAKTVEPAKTDDKRRKIDAGDSDAKK